MKKRTSVCVVCLCYCLLNFYSLLVTQTFLLYPVYGLKTDIDGGIHYLTFADAMPPTIVCIAFLMIAFYIRRRLLRKQAAYKTCHTLSFIHAAEIVFVSLLRKIMFGRCNQTMELIFWSFVFLHILVCVYEMVKTGKQFRKPDDPTAFSHNFPS